MTRIILQLLSLHLALTLQAQPEYGEAAPHGYKKPSQRKMIIFEDTTRWKPYVIKEHQFIRYRLIDSAKTLKGKIHKIHHDTLFFKSGYLLPATIDRIVNAHSKTPRFRIQQSRLFLLPDSAYHSRSSRKKSENSVMDPINYRYKLARTDTISQNFIKLNLARLLRLEIAFSYERKISPSISLEFELGYGFPVYDRSTPGSGDLFETFEYFPSEGLSLLVGPKFYRHLEKRPGFYFEPLAIVKALRYLDVFFPSDYMETPNSEFYPFGDKYTMVYGASFRMGKVRKYGKVMVDYYAGLGFQVKDITYHFIGYYNHYDGEYIYYDPVVIQKKAELWPILNLGIKMGFGF